MTRDAVFEEERKWEWGRGESKEQYTTPSFVFEVAQAAAVSGEPTGAETPTLSRTAATAEENAATAASQTPKTPATAHIPTAAPQSAGTPTTPATATFE